MDEETGLKCLMCKQVNVDEETVFMCGHGLCLSCLHGPSNKSDEGIRCPICATMDMVKKSTKIDPPQNPESQKSSWKHLSTSSGITIIDPTADFEQKGPQELIEEAKAKTEIANKPPLLAGHETNSEGNMTKAFETSSLQRRGTVTGAFEKTSRLQEIPEYEKKSEDSSDGQDGHSGQQKVQSYAQLMKTLALIAKLCDPCGNVLKQERAATHYCRKCCHLLCASCTKRHRMNRQLSRHPVYDISGTDHTFCPDHNDQLVKYLCRTCDGLMCHMCVMDDQHAKHSIVNLAESVRLHHKLEGHCDTLADSYSQAKFLHTTLEVMEYHLRKSYKDAVRSIRETVSELVSRILYQEKYLVQELDKSYSEKLEQLEACGEGLERCQGKLESTYHITKEVVERNIPAQVVGIHDILMEDIHSVERSLPLPALNLNMQKTVFISMPAPIVLGKMEKCLYSKNQAALAKELTKGTKSKLKTVVASALFTTFIAERLPKNSLTPLFRIKSRKYDKIGGFENQLVSPCDVHFLPGDEGLIVTDMKEECIRLFNGEGEACGMISHGNIQPYAVTITEQENIAITDRKDNSIKIFSTEGEILSAWTDHNFSCIGGVHYNRQRSEYIVTDIDQNCVSVHNPDGHLRSRFGSYGNGDLGFSFPCSVVCDSRNRILITDTANHCVKIYGSSGRFIQSIGGFGDEEGCFDFPSGICVDHQDNILVADWGNDRVCMFSPDGRFIRTILGSNEKIQQPHSIHLNNAGLLVLLEDRWMEDYQVTVYQLY